MRCPSNVLWAGYGLVSEEEAFPIILCCGFSVRMSVLCHFNLPAISLIMTMSIMPIGVYSVLDYHPLPENGRISVRKWKREAKVKTNDSSSEEVQKPNMKFKWRNFYSTTIDSGPFRPKGFVSVTYSAGWQSGFIIIKAVAVSVQLFVCLATMCPMDLF